MGLDSILCLYVRNGYPGVLPEKFLIFLPVIFAVLLVGGYAQIYRYRHAAALERQQVSGGVFVGALRYLFVFLALAINFTGLVDPDTRSGQCSCY
jgi:hypothetical protein